MVLEVKSERDRVVSTGREREREKRTTDGNGRRLRGERNSDGDNSHGPSIHLAS